MARRRTEVVIAGTVVVAAFVITLLALDGWDGGFGLPPPFRFVRFEALGLYDWAGWSIRAGLAAVILIAAFLVALGRRRAARSILWSFMLATILAGTAAVYAPVWTFGFSTVDRLRGESETPCGPCRFFVATILAIVVGHGVLLAVAGTRHTPLLTRRVAQASCVVTCGVLLHLHWFVIIQPIEWWPANWRDTDRLLPMRACRGAVLWELTRRDLPPLPVGEIDGLWLHFNDPRAGAPVRAVSLRGRFKIGYVWLSMADAHTLFVHADDPALRDCDGIWRHDPVAPAPWHTIGWPRPRRTTSWMTPRPSETSSSSSAATASTWKRSARSTVLTSSASRP